jgi:hypothetical protein
LLQVLKNYKIQVQKAPRRKEKGMIMTKVWSCPKSAEESLQV